MDDVFTLETHEKYIDRALNATPLNAIYELIWNACDADADEIHISFTKDDMDNITSCHIEDNGTGIDHARLEANFRYLGTSDKQYQAKSPQGRIYHGKLGQGRYNAVSVAQFVKWDTIYKRDGKFYKYSITILSSDKKHILATADSEVNATQTGTDVELCFLEKKGKVFNQLEEVIEDFVIHFAPYLKSYPTIKIFFDGHEVNVNEYIADSEEQNFSILKEGKNIDFRLLIIKWKKQKNKGLIHFCDETGTLIDIGGSYSYKGIDAYVCSPFFSDSDVAVNLKSCNFDPFLGEIVEHIMAQVNEYAESQQDAEIIRELDGLKREKIYPYTVAPQNDMERAEQAQFEILAIKVNKILPQLRRSTKKVKKLTYALLKEAAANTPDSFTEIVEHVINLSEEQKDDLAKLLRATSLPAIIKTSQLLVNRRKFLDALYLMVYDENVEKGIKERTQFQKILLDNLWIFGEDYTYGADDVSVKNLLKTYVHKLGRDELEPLIPADGAYNLDRIPDICLFKKYPIDDCHYKNLVVEIKKPKKILGKEEYDQIIDYHDIITHSAAFPGITTKWHFILIGRDYNSYVKDRINEHEQYLGRGNVIKDDNSIVTILSWGEIIERNKAKIQYLIQALELQVGEESDIIQYLHENYGKYLTDQI